MKTHTDASRHNRQSPDWIDDFGMLCWKISVLVIGLRFVIRVPLSPLLATTFAQAITLFLRSALALVLIDLLRLFWAMIRSIGQEGATQQRTRLQKAWRGWLHTDWLIMLAIDCVLAAGIIPLAITLAVQERLDWSGVVWVTLMAIIRVLFQKQSTSAGIDPSRHSPGRVP